MITSLPATSRLIRCPEPGYMLRTYRIPNPESHAICVADAAQLYNERIMPSGCSWQNKSLQGLFTSPKQKDTRCRCAGLSTVSETLSASKQNDHAQMQTPKQQHRAQSGDHTNVSGSRLQARQYTVCFTQPLCPVLDEGLNE